jgi:rRNA maturation RNase YbeY
MIRVSVFNAHRRHRIRKAPVRGYVREALRGRRIASADIAVIVIDNRYCRRLNWNYLRHSGATDVIAFTLERSQTLEGEIYVNMDRARSQARTYRVPIANELARLVIHGALHLAGEDDATARARRTMRALEDAALARFFEGPHSRRNR